MRPSGDLPVSTRNPEFSQNRFYRLCHMLIIIKGIIHGSDLRQHNAFNSAVRCKITLTVTIIYLIKAKSRSINSTEITILFAYGGVYN